MLLNTVALAVLDISAKTLRETMGSAHIVFLYKGILLLAILPWVLSKGLQGLKTERIYVHLVRSFFSVLGSLFFIHGLHYVNMADAAALENIQYVFLTLIGMVFFKEEPTVVKILAMVLGFVGAVIVVNPSVLGVFTGEEIHVAKNSSLYGYTLMAIGFWTMNSVTVKILGRTEKSKTQMFYLMLFTCLWTTPFIFIEWESVNVLGLDLQLIPLKYIGFSSFNIQPFHIKFLILMAVCFFIHGVAYFKALKREMSIVITFRYTKLLFSGVLGYLFFVEVPCKISYIGYSLIILSGLVLLLAEYIKARNKKIVAANLYSKIGD